MLTCCRLQAKHKSTIAAGHEIADLELRTHIHPGRYDAGAKVEMNATRNQNGEDSYDGVENRTTVTWCTVFSLMLQFPMPPLI